ncbi:MAG: dTDP-4-dehydrorhamnose reductase [Gaiellales bacterium]|nr:MAG: dTDP-4-dehydrorhamnose reductase [Gaiellales bacterium]
MKILVIGAAGQLGHDLMEQLPADHEVTGVDIGEIDITDPASVARVFEAEGPGLVINSAAYTNVDGCETDREAAWAVNAEGPGHVARACAEAGAALIHISTDYVFDGTAREPYREDAPVAPLGEYGRSKLAGEEAVRQALGRHLIVRTAWLFGTHGHNFVKTMLRLGRERDELKVVNDQTGAPTYSGHLARAVKGLAETRLDDPGVYHMTGGGHCTWYEFAAEIFRLAGVEVGLKRTTAAEFASPAPRPAYSVLANTRAPELALPHWREGLIECLAGLGELRQGA